MSALLLCQALLCLGQRRLCLRHTTPAHRALIWADDWVSALLPGRAEAALPTWLNQLTET
jgi:hypothetical protein